MGCRPGQIGHEMGVQEGRAGSLGQRSNQEHCLVRQRQGERTVTGSTGEGKEAQQRAFSFSSTADFAFGVRGGGSGNNMSELGGTWGGEGVVGGEEAGDRILEGV